MINFDPTIRIGTVTASRNQCYVQTVSGPSHASGIGGQLSPRLPHTNSPLDSQSQQSNP